MTDLSDKMRALAATGHARRDELIAKAKEFDDKSSGFYGAPQTVNAPSFLGAWARARKCWSESSGEPLV